MKRKEKILQDIAELFFERGYEKTSIRRMSKSLNISKPGLYYHFENKQEILFKIVDDFMEKMLSSLRERIDFKNNPEKELFGIIQNHINFFVKYPAQTKVVIYEVHSLEGEYSERLKNKQKEYIAIVKKVLKRIIGNKNIKIDLNVATFCLLGMLNWIVQWYKPEGRVPPDRLATDICVFFLNGLNANPSFLFNFVEK